MAGLKFGAAPSPAVHPAGKALPLDLAQLSSLRNAGYDAFEIYTNPKLISNPEAFAKQAKINIAESGLKPISLHAPAGLEWTPNIVKEKLHQMENAMKVAKLMNVGTVVVHPPFGVIWKKRPGGGYTPILSGESEILERMRQIMNVKRKLGYRGKVLVENIDIEPPGTMTNFRTYAKLNKIADGFVLDMEHFAMMRIDQAIRHVYNPLQRFMRSKGLGKWDDAMLRDFYIDFGRFMKPSEKQLFSGVLNTKLNAQDRIIAANKLSAIVKPTTSTQKIFPFEQHRLEDFAIVPGQRVFDWFFKAYSGLKIEHMHISGAYVGMPTKTFRTKFGGIDTTKQLVYEVESAKGRKAFGTTSGWYNAHQHGHIHQPPQEGTMYIGGFMQLVGKFNSHLMKAGRKKEIFLVNEMDPVQREYTPPRMMREHQKFLEHFPKPLISRPRIKAAPRGR
ncbi:MAG: TIM barrel protein [Candidatus Diapherotrites archaeon]|nr:TIM barrel protein [Candidatus Diapherotrites archaeon]